MVIWTWTLTAVFILTLVRFIEHRVIRLLFPPMAHVTRSPILTTCQIVINHMLGLPIYAWYRLIWINRRIPTIILPIMCIYTLIFFVFCQIKNTEFRFIIKHIKVLILKIVVNQFGLYLLLTVSVGTKLFVRTLRDRIRPMCTKTFSIILWVVLLFNWWMSLCTLVAWWTLLSLFNVWTHISWVEIPWSATIFLIMIIDAQFMIVFDRYITRCDFEYVEIELLCLN